MGNIQQIPASVLASWPKPNYVDPERRAWMPTFAMIWQVASSMLVGGRFYLRMRRLAGPFGYDDAFMLIAWMTSVSFTACAWVTTAHYGVDRHTWDVNVKLFSGAAMYAWILQVLMLISSGATKASVLLFYRRLVTGTLARRWRYAIYFALVFHALYLIGITLGYVLICRPLHAYWMSYDFDWDEKYTCAPAAGLNPVIGILSIVSDVYAVALPFIILHYYDLDVPRSQKIGLNIIFALGLLVAGAGVGRTYYLMKLGKTYDTSWTGFDLLVWTIIELQLGIICACAPSLRAFFRRYLSGVFSRTHNSTSRSRTRTRSEGYRSTTDKHGNSFRDKELEAIDMQILTERSSRDRTPEPPEIPARSVSPTYTFASRSITEARSISHPMRSESQHSRQWPSTQDISTAIMKAQEIHSTV